MNAPNNRIMEGWIEEANKEMQIMRLKHCLSRNDGGVWGADPTGSGDTPVLRSTEQTVDGLWQFESLAYRTLSPSEKSSSLLEDGDLLVTKSSGSSLHIGKTTLVDAKIATLGCCYSNFMQRLRTNHKLIPKLAWYLLNNRIVRMQLDISSNSTTGLANLNATILGDVLVPVSKREHQERLTSWLDNETARIDTLVAKKTRFIDLLREKRQALMTQAVTKGLDSNAPMKDSGVAWLGKVPAHWNVVKSRRLFSERNQKARPNDKQLTVSQKYGLLPQTEFMEREGRRIVVVQKGHDILKRVMRGDFVISMRSFQGGLELSEHEGSVSSAYVPITPIKWVVPSYFRWVFKSITYIQALQATSDLVRDGQALRFENFAKVELPHIPEEEQLAIASYIDRSTARIDALIAKTERSIELLREHRTALITAAVTGKIDLRDVA